MVSGVLSPFVILVLWEARNDLSHGDVIKCDWYCKPSRMWLENVCTCDSMCSRVSQAQPGTSNCCVRMLSRAEPAGSRLCAFSRWKLFVPLWHSLSSFLSHFSPVSHSLSLNDFMEHIWNEAPSHLRGGYSQSKMCPRNVLQSLRTQWSFLYLQNITLTWSYVL